MINSSCSFSRLFPTFLFLATLVAPMANAQPADGLRVKIECEEPSGIFLDSDTLATRRAVLFSIHVFNETGEARQATLDFRFRNAAGKVVQAGEQKNNIPAGGVITRRELFTPPERGAFELEATGFSRRDGPDLNAKQSFPFAVIVAPQAGDARPFLLMDAPLDIQETQLDSLARLGVLALRTEVSQPVRNDGDNRFWANLGLALQARESRGMATVGVLRAPLGEGIGRNRDDEEWLQWALRVMLQTPSIRTWEVTGRATPATISELARAARNMNPARGVLATGYPGSDWKQLQPADGLFYPLTAEAAAVHPAALRRSLLGAQSRAVESGLPSFHVRDLGAMNIANNNSDSPLQSAQLMTTQTVAALAARAQGASTRMFSPEGITHEGLARGVAFAALKAQLGTAEIDSELFPTSPVVRGAIFAKDNNAGSIAVLWTSPGLDGKESKGKLETWLESAQTFDLFGNPITAVERKVVSIPLSAQPVFVVSSSRPEALSRNLREGWISGIDPLAAQVLPLEQPIEHFGEMKPRDNKFPPSNKLAIRVRLHNIGVGNVSGTIKLNPPPSWKLAVDNQQFELKPGESRIYAFAVDSVKPNDLYPVKVEATGVMQNGGKSVKGKWGWNQNAPVVTATNAEVGDELLVDGHLGDWNNAQWMELKSKDVSGRLALKWDEERLYLAARVREPQLTARNAAGAEYSFWRNSDAIQVGFGLRDAAWMQPGSTPFRDTDFGFLLSPFHTRPDGTIEARVLRLWSPQIAFGTLPDRVRWGGAVPGARIEIRRDERSGETVYEAAIPLTEIPDLSPAARVATERETTSGVRFGWILHNDEGVDLQWAQQANLFPWWNNNGSFLPAGRFANSAQTTLGFSRKGEVAAGRLTPAPPPLSGPAITTPPAVVPVPPAPPERSLPPYMPNVDAAPTEPTPAPTTRPTSRPTTRITPASPRALPRPVPVEPVPADLPPAPQD